MTIHLYSQITGATLAEVQRQLANFTGKEITVRINSPGGSVFDGLAIHQLLKSHAARVVVSIDGIAASIASIIALAGDEIRIATGAMMMLHDASIATRGNSRELTRDAATVAKVSESLTDIYCQTTKQSREKIRAMMEAETWLNASEAVALGFAHKIVAGQKIAACAWNPADYPSLPQAALVAAGLTTAPATRRDLAAELDRLRDENARLRLRQKAATANFLKQDAAAKAAGKSLQQSMHETMGKNRKSTPAAPKPTAPVSNTPHLDVFNSLPASRRGEYLKKHAKEISLEQKR